VGAGSVRGRVLARQRIWDPIGQLVVAFLLLLPGPPSHPHPGGRRGYRRRKGAWGSASVTPHTLWRGGAPHGARIMQDSGGGFPPSDSVGLRALRPPPGWRRDRRAPMQRTAGMPGYQGRVGLGRRRRLSASAPTRQSGDERDKQLWLWLCVVPRHQIQSPKRPTKSTTRGRLPQSDLPQ
jgi:hypothetical protein